MPATITYRPMVSEDAEAVRTLCIELFDIFVAPSCTAEGREAFVAYNSLELLRQWAQEDHVFVACDGETIVGMIDLTRTGHLKRLFVGERYQKKGIGRTLFDKAVEAAKADGTKRITVNSSLNSISYYEKLGFKRGGEERVREGIAHMPMWREVGL